MAGPVEHAAKAALAVTRTGRIGVAATDYTARTGVYGETLRSLAPGIAVTEVGSSEWVQWVERAKAEPEKWTREAKDGALERGLEPFRKAGCDTVILGCTHFPALADEIRAAYGAAVELVDGADGIASWLEASLEGRTVGRSPWKTEGRFDYIVTAEEQRFQQLGRELLRMESFTPRLEEAWPSRAK